jgi:hypothetical protein
MATGRLGVQDLTADTDTTVYTVPVGSYAVANVSITNRNATSISMKLAMATTGTPTAAEWIEWNTIIIPNGVFERTGLVLQGGLNIVVNANLANVGVTVYGIETSTT